jgi:manganese transport protein
LVLLYITFRPLLKKMIIKSIRSTHQAPPLGDITTPIKFSRIVVAIDFSIIDTEVIRFALSQANANSKILIIHVVESVGAIVYGQETIDYETIQDKSLLEKYQLMVQSKGIDTSIHLGFGNPKIIIPEKVIEFNADLLLMGAHGHKGLNDIVFGTTVDKVRHKVNIPVLIVKG